MRGFNYHFTMNPVNQTIKLRPTMGTYAKAFAPTVVFVIAVPLVGKVIEIKEKRELNKQSTTPQTA